MGGKRFGKRKHIHLCIAVLILLIPLGCGFNQLMNTKMADASGEEARAHLALGQKFFTEGNFTGALRENETVLSLAGRNVPIDEALFSISLIYAYPDNPAKDHGKSLIALEKLIKGYSESPLVRQAKVIMGLIQDNDNFTRRVERLNNVIGELQKTDTRIEVKGEEKPKPAEKLKIEDQANTIKVLTQENEKLSRNIEKLNTIIDELKRVDIDVDLRKKRDKAK